MKVPAGEAQNNMNSAVINSQANGPSGFSQRGCRLRPCRKSSSISPRHRHRTTMAHRPRQPIQQQRPIVSRHMIGDRSPASVRRHPPTVLLPSQPHAAPPAAKPAAASRSYAPNPAHNPPKNQHPRPPRINITPCHHSRSRPCLTQHRSRARSLLLLHSGQHPKPLPPGASAPPLQQGHRALNLQIPATRHQPPQLPQRLRPVRSSW